MLEKIVAAFDQKDYQTAAKYVSELLQQSPEHSWGRLYLGRLHEVSGRIEAATALYRQILQDTTNPKIAIQARQGLQRQELAVQAQRQAEIAQATADPTASAPGLLILEAVSGAARAAASQQLARIMQLDAYSARLQIPNRGWRIYRMGAIGELQFYCQQLRAAAIPAFCAKVAAVQAVPVFSVLYFQTYDPTVTVICQNEQGQKGALSFAWAEVQQQVEGLLPIFEQVVDVDLRQGLSQIQRQRKLETQDYAHVCDLHLPQRQCILRLCDLTYQFRQGIYFLPAQVTGNSDHSTNRLYWNSLRQFLAQFLPQCLVWADFTPFAETALNHALLLKRIQPHLSLPGQEDSQWHPAFQLYSSLAFLRD
jgi:Tetratricopeptide repeat